MTRSTWTRVKVERLDHEPSHDLPKKIDHPMSKALATRCIARNRQGGRCKNKAIIGATVCRLHGGKTPKVAARAAVRAELMQWGLEDAHESPCLLPDRAGSGTCQVLGGRRVD